MTYLITVVSIIIHIRRPSHVRRYIVAAPAYDCKTGWAGWVDVL